MTLTYKPHEKLSLRSVPVLSEAWLHQQIVDNPAILGLGEVEVLGREKRQFSGGRLDLLLADTENNIRYEVEIMLGATDPGHIIRCIEYWDHEKRLYPSYDHVAVLIAEEVTTRFLNVIGLFAGSIPIIAIQLNALKVDDHVLLDFVKVVDQRVLREDDSGIQDEDVDRQWWETRKGIRQIQLCDQFLALAKKVSGQPLELRFKKTRIALTTTGSFFNIVGFWPKKNFVRARFTVSEAARWVGRLEEAGFDAQTKNDSMLEFRLAPDDFAPNEALLRELVKHAVEDSHAS